MTMFTPPGEGGTAARGRQVARRVMAVLLVLLVTAGVVVLAWRLASESPSDNAGTEPRVSCPPPGPTSPAVPADQVKVNVYNATDRAGLAGRTARALERRGFRIGAIDDDTSGRTVTGPGEVRHGEAGLDAVRTLSAHVGDVIAVPDQRRKRAVDLALGPGFRGLLPVAAASAALSPSPQPTPSGC